MKPMRACAPTSPAVTYWSRSVRPSRRVALVPCAVAPPSPQAACPPEETAKQMKALYKEQDELVDCIKSKNKRVKKLAKKVRKAPLQEKSQLQMDIKSLLVEINFDNEQLAGLISRMTDAGYVEDGCSSSEEEDPQNDILEAAMGGVQKLVSLKRGTVTVCNGKACIRKGKSDIIEQSLQRQWEGKAVAMQTCSCMGSCKTAANVQIECDGNTTMITGLSPPLLKELGKLEIVEPALQV